MPKLTLKFTLIYLIIGLLAIAGIYYLGMPIFVRYMMATYGVDIDVLHQLVKLFLILMISFLVLLLVTQIVTNFFVHRPLVRITRGAEEFSRSNLEYRIPVHTRDELGELATTLNNMAQSLEEADEYQKQFIANISHDFRSPLTSIQGYLRAMIDGVIPPENQNKYMLIIISETTRLANLTQSMLSLNSLSAERLDLEMSDFDIVSMIRKVCETMEGRCTERGLKLQENYSRSQIMVHADLGRIQQVVYNLLDNAIKFSPDGSGPISVKVTEGRGDKVVVSVKDHGVGISKEELPHIWTRFYKTDASRGKDKTGTGLGLAIVKEVLIAHGETIDVASTPGSGSEFTFRLPKA